MNNRVRATWLPATVDILCGWCGNVTRQMSLAQARNTGTAAMRCRHCRVLNTLPNDLLAQAKHVPEDNDPDNPPGRAEAWERVVGQAALKRAMEVAITGYLTLVYVGPLDYAWEEVQDIMGPWARTIQSCPCGHFLAHDGELCTCTWDAVEAHRKSRPFQEALDCDLIVRAVAPDEGDFYDTPEPYATVYARVSEARMSQAFGAATQPRAEWDNYRHIGDAPSFKILNDARKRWDLSTPKRMLSVQRVAHTIALLDGDTLVRAQHMAEALMFRAPLQLENGSY